MKFECDSCGANYMIADEKVGKRGVKVKCKRCSHVIIVRPEAVAASEDLPDPSVELNASDATPPADASGGDSGGGVFSDETAAVPPEMDDGEMNTTVGHPPGFSNSGDDVDLGSMAGADDDAWASSSSEGDDDASGADASDSDETAGLAAATSGEDELSGFDGDGEEETMGADGLPAPAMTDEDGSPSLDDQTAAGGSADDAWSVSGGSDPVPDPPALGDDGDDGDTGGDAWSTAGGDDEVPPPPGLDDGDDFSANEEKTSVGGVPGWNMSGENDTQQGAMPDVTDPNMQMPSMPDVGGLGDGDGAFSDEGGAFAASAEGGDAFGGGDDDDVPAPSGLDDEAGAGLAGEDDALSALAGMGAGADGDGELPVPPELDAGELPAEADATMPGADAPQGEESDAFDAQLAGAFSNMFGDAPGGDPNAPQEGAFGDDMEGFRGPTQVLDAPQMDALREQATPSDEGYRDNTNETFPSNLDAAYNTLGGTMDTAMGDPIGGDMPTQMADIEEDEGGWHVAIDDEDVGPLSLHEIAEHIQGGRVDRDSLVWRTGMDDWEPAGDVPQMASIFDALPMPTIDAGFDVGAPIDDMGGPPPGADPFSKVPDVSADPNWQPHGLTDVYQAANLAEAAGLGLPNLGKSNGTAPQEDDDDEGEWRPGAAGALAALVEHEINRIDTDPVDEVSSPGLAPADDAGPGLLAEGAGAGAEIGGLGSAPSSAGFPVGGGLGAVGGLSTPGLSTPAMPMGGMSSPALSTPAMQQVPTVDTYPPQAAMSGFAPVQPPAQQKSMVPWIVGGVVVVVVVLVAGIAATAAIVMSMNNQPVVAAAGDNPSGAAGDTKGNDDGTKVAMASDTAKADDAADKPSAAPADDGTAGEAKAGDGSENKDEQLATAADKQDDAKPTDKKVDAKADDKKAETKKAETKKAETKKAETQPEEPKKVAAKRSDRRKSSRSRSSARRADKPKVEKRKDPPKERGKRRKVSRKGDCDPILDIDCDEKKSGKSKRKSNVKEQLSKSDILVVVKNNIRAIKQCFKSNGVKDTVKMEWKISKSGRTRGVRVLTGKYAGTPMGRCMTNAVKRFKFPKYSGSAPPPIKFPFKP